MNSENTNKSDDWQVKIEEMQWLKGETFCFMIGLQPLNLKYTGSINNGESVKFKLKNHRFLQKLWAIITRTKPGIIQIVKIGDFFETSRLNSNNKIRSGFSPVELVGKDDEPDYILRIVLHQPFKKES